MIPVPNLTEALEEYFLNAEDTWDNSKLHVSDLSVGVPIDQGGTCHRQLWYRLNGYEKKEPSVGQRLMWDQGHAMEKRLNSYVKDVLEGQGWILVDLGIRTVELPGGIIGEYDALLLGLERSLSYSVSLILDNKTLRGRAFQYMDEARNSHIIQVQGYIKGANADGGILWYADREGQNTPIQYFVQRDDQAVEEASEVALSIMRSKECPLLVHPKFKLKENKHSVSVLVFQPWQCDWCDYLDITCPGALPAELRSKGGKVIGRLEDDRVVVKEDYNNQDYEWLLYSLEKIDPLLLPV